MGKFTVTGTTKDKVLLTCADVETLTGVEHDFTSVQLTTDKMVLKLAGKSFNVIKATTNRNGLSVALEVREKHNFRASIHQTADIVVVQRENSRLDYLEFD